MPTSQSLRNKNRQPARFRLSPERREAVRQRQDELRISQPLPVYPIDRRAGARIGALTLALDGIACVQLVLVAPGGTGSARARCDQFGVIDTCGAVLATATGKTSALALLAARWPRLLSRRALAAMQLQCTARDAADCERISFAAPY